MDTDRDPSSVEIRDIRGQKSATFYLELPAIARAAHLSVQELNFLDYRTLVTGWLDENSW